jgi:hypothetical protein
VSNCVKYSVNQQITSTFDFPPSSISDETKIRVVVEQANSGNIVTVKARIVGQQDWDLLDTITGNSKTVVNVSTYDEILVQCTNYDSLTNFVRIVASSFNEAGGSTTIDAPTGGSVDGDVITFTSSDSSVEIVANPGTNTIDFKAVGSGSVSKYTKTILLTDWVGPSAGEYSLSIPFSFHAKINPVVTCMELNGSDYEVIDCAIFLNSNDVTLKVLSSPDTRFVGKIFIE